MRSALSLPLLAALLFAGCGPKTSVDPLDDTGDSSVTEDDTADTDAPDDTDDSGDPTDTGDPYAEVLILCINEFMADNKSSYSEDGENFPDWIEIYNPGEEDLDLVGWSISDDHEAPDTHVFQSSLEVEAKGFVVLSADEAISDGVEHLNFKLSASGEEIALFSPDGRRVDWVVFGEQLSDIAAARIVDGSEEDGWDYVAGGTPGASNAGAQDR